MRFVALLIAVLSATPAEARRWTRPADKPAPGRRFANLRAFGRGVAEGPAHLLGHLKKPKNLALALGVTAAMGIGVEATGIDVETVARPLLLSVLAIRWGQAIPRIRRAIGPERWRHVGRELIGTAEITAELAGVHLLGHDHAAEAGAAGSGLLRWGKAAAQGVLAFHEVFYLRFDKGHGHEHEHGHRHAH